MDIPNLCPFKVCGDFTISAWFKSDANCTQNIISLDDDTGFWYMTTLHTTAGCVHATYTGQGNTSPVQHFCMQKAMAYQGCWVHVAITLSGLNTTTSTSKMYVNGQYITSCTRTSTITTAVADKAAIGRYHGTSIDAGSNLTTTGSYFKGKMGTIRIYNCTLTDNEIQQDFSGSKITNCLTTEFNQSTIHSSNWYNCVTGTGYTTNNGTVNNTCLLGYGNVGIGTSAPDANVELHVKDPTPNAIVGDPL